MRRPEYRELKKQEIMEKCFECYCDNGLRNTGIKELGKYCEMTSANLYSYFPSVDDIITESTEHCMSQVEREFMAKAPDSADELYRFIDEAPYWMAENHGKEYRLMYQVYTHPKYIGYGKKFMDEESKRYIEYAKGLSSKLGILADALSGFMILLVRTVVHYAMFEDDPYLKTQTAALKLLLDSILKGA